MLMSKNINSDVSKDSPIGRRLQQRKRRNKLELCVKLSVLRLFHVDHVVQNRQSFLSLAWHERFSGQGREQKIYCCVLALSSEPQI